MRKVPILSISQHISWLKRYEGSQLETIRFMKFHHKIPLTRKSHLVACLLWKQLIKYKSVLCCSKPKTQRVKRELAKREPKIHENDKKPMFIKGGHTSEKVTQTLKELVQIFYVDYSFIFNLCFSFFLPCNPANKCVALC